MHLAGPEANELVKEAMNSIAAGDTDKAKAITQKLKDSGHAYTAAFVLKAIEKAGDAAE